MQMTASSAQTKLPETSTWYLALITNGTPMQVTVSRSIKGNALRLALSKFVRSTIALPIDVDEWEFSYAPDGPRLDFDKEDDLRPNDEEHALYLLPPASSSSETKRRADKEGGSYSHGETVSKKQRGKTPCCRSYSTQPVNP
jgi:hypothetical protein